MSEYKLKTLAGLVRRAGREKDNAELTKPEFEKLLIKASQPLPEKVEQSDSSKVKTSESRSSGDCNESHTR